MPLDVMGRHRPLELLIRGRFVPRQTRVANGRETPPLFLSEPCLARRPQRPPTRLLTDCQTTSRQPGRPRDASVHKPTCPPFTGEHGDSPSVIGVHPHVRTRRSPVGLSPFAAVPVGRPIPDDPTLHQDGRLPHGVFGMAAVRIYLLPAVQDSLQMALEC